MTHRFLAEYLIDLNKICADLERDFTTLQRRLIAWAQDGYPANTGTLGSKGGFSDPTAAAVMNPDQVRKDREALRELIINAHTQLTRAEQIRARYINNTNTTAKHNNTLTKCANQHGCPDDAWAAKASRCLTCYEYNRTNNRDRRKSTNE
jgi:hypothetical protein